MIRARPASLSASEFAKPNALSIGDLMKSKTPTPRPRKAGPAKSGQKRSRGRPRTNRLAVGREAIVVAARQLLEKLPPHKVPNVLIARKAGVDPALVRYYFGNREELLLAVVEHILSNWLANRAPLEGSPAERLSAHIGSMLEFSCRVRSMQRLMIEGCAEAKTPSVRARAQKLNAAVLPFYARFLHLQGDKAESSPDPLFMHVAIIGMCEFFAAAQAMIRPIAPRNMDADELARRYETFIRDLMLDGLRARIERPGTSSRSRTPEPRS